MTTSLDKTYSATANEIIEDAYDHIRVTQEGQNLTAYLRSKAERKLNNIIKGLQKDGLHIWKEADGVVFLQPGRRSYTLGNQSNFVCAADDVPTEDNTVHACVGDWVATTLTADAAAAQPVIDIASLTSYNGVTFNTSCTTYVGVENENGILEWSTISTISSLEITLADNLTAACESGASVYLYRTKMAKPLKILQDSVRLRLTGGSENPVSHFAYSDYNSLGDKHTQGQIVQVFYQPKIDTGELTTWPTANSVKSVLLFRYMQELDIFDATTTQDLPSEWIRFLGWVLAAELAPSKGVPLDRQTYLDMKAGSLKEQLEDWDQDNTSVFLQPAYSEGY